MGIISTISKAVGGKTSILDIGSQILSVLYPDPVERDKARLELLRAEQEGKLKEIEIGIQAVIAEAQGASWLQRNWRPITMLSFVTIVVNNYILYPYLSLFWHEAPILPLPQDLWELIKIGLGGYVVGRTVEKSVSAWKGK